MLFSSSPLSFRGTDHSPSYGTPCRNPSICCFHHAAVRLLRKSGKAVKPGHTLPITGVELSPSMMKSPCSSPLSKGP